MTSVPGTPRQRWPLFVLAAIYACGSAARFAVAQLITNPLVSSDELVYRNMALSFFRTGSFFRTAELGKVAELPNVLYSLLISPSLFFGDHFFAAAHLINSLVIHLSLFAVYAMAREFMDQRKALVAAATTAFLPAFNTPMFLMTESLVYPVFLAAFYCAYKAMTSPRPAWRIASGAAFAIAMLTKPGFALLILSAALVYAGALAVALSSHDTSRARSLLASFATVAGAGLAAFAALSFALKGGIDYGLSTYRIFTSGEGAARDIPWSGLARCAGAHLGTFLFAWYLPAVVCARAAVNRDSEGRLRLFLAFTFATLLVYLWGVLKLTGVMAFQENFLRLHGRYYSMAFPLLIIGFLAECGRHTWGPWARAASVAFCAAVAAVNIAIVFPIYAASGLLIVDYPDLAWHLRWPGLVTAISAAMVVQAFWYARRARPPPYPALALLAGICVMASTGDAQQAMDFDRINSAQVDPLKRMVRQRLPDNTARVAVVDSIHLCRFTLAFWYPYHYTASLNIPAGTNIERSRIPDDTEYIVACDDYRFEFPVTELARDGAKAIYAVTRE